MNRKLDLNKTFMIILRVVFLSFSIVYLYNYFSFKKIIEHDRDIQYRYVSKAIHHGKRTKSQSMKIHFKNEDYTIHITSKEYNAIDKGKLPLLYYDASRNMVFSKWEKTSGLRIFFIFASFFALSFIKIKKKGAAKKVSRPSIKSGLAIQEKNTSRPVANETTNRLKNKLKGLLKAGEQTKAAVAQKPSDKIE